MAFNTKNGKQHEWDICNNEDTIRSMDISYSLQQLNLSKKCYESKEYVSYNSAWIWSLSLLFNENEKYIHKKQVSIKEESYYQNRKKLIGNYYYPL